MLIGPFVVGSTVVRVVVGVFDVDPWVAIDTVILCEVAGVVGCCVLTDGVVDFGVPPDVLRVALSWLQYAVSE